MTSDPRRGPEGARTAFVREAPPLVVEALRESGWQLLRTPEDATLVWRHEPSALREMWTDPGRVCNHLPGIGALSTKSGLHRSLLRGRAVAQARSDRDVPEIAPQAFLLPQEGVAFLRAAAADPAAWWIEKPQASSRGRGIALVRDPMRLPMRGGYLVQRYLAQPHLIDGFKYSLRCYVVIASLDPLTVYLHRDGFVKLASRPFSADPSSRDDLFRHLTNPDILALDPTVPVSSRNLTHEAYRSRMRAEGLAVDALFADIAGIVRRAVIAAAERLRASRRAHEAQGAHFEILGLDVALDADGRPWLIECNLNPSLEVEADPTTRSALEELDVKRSVVRDLVALLPTIAGAAPAPASVGRFDRVLPDASDASAWHWTPICRASDHRPIAAAAGLAPERLQAGAVSRFGLGDHLVLHRAGRLHLLNAGAAYLWSAAADGLSPRDILDELAAAAPAAMPPEALLRDSLADWVQQGLLDVAGAAPGSVASVPGDAPATLVPPLRWDPLADTVVHRGLHVVVRFPDAAVRDRVRAALQLAAPSSAAVAAVLELRRTSTGFLLSRRGHREVPCAGVGEAVAAVHDALDRIADAQQGIVARCSGAWLRRGDRMTFVVGTQAFGHGGRLSALHERYVEWSATMVQRDGATTLCDASGGVATDMLVVSPAEQEQREVLQGASLLEAVLAAGLRLTDPTDAAVTAVLAWAQTQQASAWRGPAAALAEIASAR